MRLGLVLLAFLLLGGCQSVPPPTSHTLGARLDASVRVLAAPSASSKQRERALIDARALVANHLPKILDDANESALVPAGQALRGVYSPEKFADLVPVLQPRVTRAGLHRIGIGLPMVGHLSEGGPNAPRAGYRVPVTLVALPKSDPKDCCKAALVDPERMQALRTAHGDFPIAMDLEAPIDATRATGPRLGMGLINLLRPDRFAGQPRIVFLQPYEPDKIPVVLVHGLLSTPSMWEPLVRGLLADERVRTSFQLWFFYYPTGQPVPLSALQLREALDEVAREHGAHKRMVLIGHSMGGILCRAQVSRIDPKEAERISPGVSALPEDNPVRRALIFEPRADVSRTVFMFTPHRGSRLADNRLGAWGARLIRLPDTLIGQLARYTSSGSEDLDARRLPTSISGLSPRSPFLRTLDRTQPSVPTHSIIGDRGSRRGSRWAGSDGVVTYASAHLESAESEVVVPTGHGGFANPLAIAELRRILDLALRDNLRTDPITPTADRVRRTE